jgi:hypothetical protein
MTLTFGNIRIGTKHLYFILVLIMFMTDMLFFELIVGARGSEGIQGKGPETWLLVVAVLFSILLFRQLSPFLKKWALVGFVFLLYLVLESFYEYGRPIVYPHVFFKASMVFVVLFLYPIFTFSRGNQIKWMALLVTVVFFVHLITLKAETLSIASFMANERGFNATTVYLLMLPMLFFFNRYLADKNFMYLLGLFVILFFIFFLQHRTVWITSAIALLLNIILLKTKSAVPVRFPVFLPIILIPLFAVITVSTLFIAKNPEVLEQLGRRIEDIQNIESQGTGSWRLEQFKSYLPFIEQHFLMGMRYEGFELPIQFYDHNDQIVWAENTGHHFHSWYVDRLFYFGLLGVLFFIIPMLYLVIKAYRVPALNPDQIIIITFALSGIVYGLSYDWPSWFYGILGIALAYIDREPEQEKVPPVQRQQEHPVEYSSFK